MNTIWTKTGRGLESMIHGTVYLIEKRSTYVLWADGEWVNGGFRHLTEAKVAAEAHASAPPYPAPSKSGVHIDNIAGQQLVDILKRSFTTAQIQDFIDASPYDEPDTGAPEAGV
jgi:hypothetical protein